MNFNTPNTSYTANEDVSFESKDRIDMEHKIKHDILLNDFKKELSKIMLEKLADKIREIDQDGDKDNDKDNDKVNDYDE